jgi:outer membrane receptor for ferrienterochelin and colicin
MLVQHRHARTISASRFAFGASLLAIALAQPAQAQSAEAPPSPAATAGSTSAQSGSPVDSSNDIIITGTRQSLANAQTIKRNSDTIVDAITADDIGSLPDRSVNEALQRIPGVAISRFASPSDSQHYSAQGSGVAIRGLS